MAPKKEYVNTPGLRQEISRFTTLLNACSEEDHILIYGPRGCGKSYFLEILGKELKDVDIEKIPHRNCAALSPDLVDSELFDRMIHHSIIISIEGPSWRLHESRQLNSAK